MLAMTAVIVDYMFKVCFSLLLHGPGCINNALINALKKLTL